MEIVIAIAGFLVGTITLVAVFYGWLGKRIENLDKMLRKHDKADKRLRKELAAARKDAASLRENMETGFKNWAEVVASVNSAMSSAQPGGTCI